MTPPKVAQFRKDVVEHVKAHGTTNWILLAETIAARHDVVLSPDTLRKYWSRHRVEVVEPPEDTPQEAFEKRTETQALRDRIAKLESELKVAARESNLREVLREIAAATAPTLPRAGPLWKPEKPSKYEIVETVYQFLSDLHAYEEVSGERTRGHNVYTAEIMAKRMGQCVRSHSSIVSGLREGPWRFPEGVVGLGGDNVSGTIHELERHMDTARNIILAVYGCAFVLAQSIRHMSRLYEKTYVYGVGGNHARLPGVKRKQVKDPTRTWDYLIYLLIREMLREQENVEFWFPDSWGAQVDIRGWNVLLGHGDDVKSWAGIPWYGITRKTTQTQALEAARGNPIDYQFLGHFHEAASIPHPAGETIINGCVIGGNEYSIESLAKSSKPAQWLFGFHEQHGITSRWNLQLEPQDEDIPEIRYAPWLEVQQQDWQGGAPVWRIA